MDDSEANELRVVAREARERQDTAAMCRVALFNEHRAKNRLAARTWLVEAAGHDSVPALHELVRLAVADRDFEQARDLLGRIGNELQGSATTADGGAPTRPTSPRPAEVTGTWVQQSGWSGADGWVSIAPDILGKDMHGVVVEFDSDGVSMSGEVIYVVTPEAGRGVDVLQPVVEDELMRLNWMGERVTFEDPGRPNLAYVTEVEEGVRVDFDNKGEVGAPMGRAVVRLLATALTDGAVPAQLANLSSFAGLFAPPTDPRAAD